MAEQNSAVPPSTPKKRSHDGQLVHDAGATMTLIVDRCEPLSKTSEGRGASPTPSSTGSSLTDLTSTVAQSPMPSKSEPQAKKRKLTFAEREVEKAVKKRQKDVREKQKEEERSRKGDEKRLRDDEKRKKEEGKEMMKRSKELDKAEKQKIKDAKRQEKEAEEAKKDAERLKKERAQMKLGAFFGRPAPASTPPTTPDDVSIVGSSRRSSIASVDTVAPLIETEGPQPANPDFKSWIVPFFVHEWTELAPTNRFRAGSHHAGASGDQTEFELVEGDEQTPQPISGRFGKPRRRVQRLKPVKSIIEAMQANSIASIGGTGDAASVKHIDPLNTIAYKVLSFREDIRPPYRGTYTKPVSPRSSRKVAINPFHRGLPDTDYDYDSEVEWEEPGPDDDDINLEDEESEDEDGEEEMDDFLDDANDEGRRRMIVGDQQPVCSGLFWEGESIAGAINMDDYRMDVINDCTRWPIDPYSSVHWSETTKASPVKVQADAKPAGATMQPPRMPLVAVKAPNTLPALMSVSTTLMSSLQNENSRPIVKQRGRPPDPNKPMKMISAEFLPAFRQAVQGSDLTKAGLIEILKKQFPKCAKDAIKDTLGCIAVRQGAKEVEKKWTLIA